MYNIWTQNFQQNAAHAWTHETNKQDTKQWNQLQIRLSWIQLWLCSLTCWLVVKFRNEYSKKCVNIQLFLKHYGKCTCMWGHEYLCYICSVLFSFVYRIKFIVLREWSISTVAMSLGRKGMWGCGIQLKGGVDFGERRGRMWHWTHRWHWLWGTKGCVTLNSTVALTLGSEGVLGCDIELNGGGDTLVSLE